MNKNVKIAKQLIKLAKCLIASKGGYYRGIRQKVKKPYSNSSPFAMWLTPQIEIAQMYSENGTLFEIDLDESRLNIATYDDILDIDEDNEFGEATIDAIIDGDEDLIQFLKKHGYNGMVWYQDGDELMCIFDKSLIKDYWKIQE